MKDLYSWHREVREGDELDSGCNSNKNTEGATLTSYLCVFSSIWWFWLVLQDILKQSPANEVYRICFPLDKLLVCKTVTPSLQQAPTSLSYKPRVTSTPSRKFP